MEKKKEKDKSLSYQHNSDWKKLIVDFKDLGHDPKRSILASVSTCRTKRSCLKEERKKERKKGKENSLMQFLFNSDFIKVTNVIFIP